MIHITDGQSDKILDVIPDEDYEKENHHKSLKDTLETFVFTTFADKRYSQYLVKRNRVIISDDDGRFVEFIINEAFEYRDGNGLKIEVYSQASYLEDLKKGKVIRPGNTGNKTNIQHATDTLSGTLWQPGRIQFVGIRSFNIENYTNPYSFSKMQATEFQLELQFRIEVEGSSIIGRFMDMVERIGEWRGREVEFGKDLLNIRRRETGDIVTALLGVGPIREDGTRLEVLVEDKEALERWGRGQHIIDPYEPISDDSEMTRERLIQLTQNELKKRVNALIEYETTIADLENVSGMENEKIRYGDTIRIKDTKFNPPLYLEARIHTMDRSPKDKSKKSVALGDYIEYTEEEVNANWRALQAEIAKKASMNEVMSYAEKIIPELTSPPNPEKYPKYIDVSGEIPKLMLWDGTQFTSVKGDKGDPGPNIVNKDTTFGDKWLVASYIESLNGLDVGNGQFVVDNQGNVKFAGDLEGATGNFSGNLTTSELVIGEKEPQLYPWREDWIPLVTVKNPVRVSDNVYQWGDPFQIVGGNNYFVIKSPGTIGFEKSISTPELVTSKITLNNLEQGIVEQGSNANGEYIRFASGIQICFLNTFSTTSNTSGGLATDWNYPATFSSSPFVLASLNSSNYINFGLTVQRPSNANATFRALGLSASTTYTMAAFAIGRWK